MKPDVCRDVAFTSKWPNVRPEMCPRSNSNTTTANNNNNNNNNNNPLERIFGPSILSVGDGDLTFSYALRRMFDTSTSKIHATSYETNETLLKVYGSKINEVVDEIGRENVSFSVDATNLRPTLTKAAPATHDESFSSIVWNFPCTAEEAGQDGQNTEMERNKDLLREFTKCAASMLRGGGNVVITHKTKPPYNQWNIVHVIEGVTLDSGMNMVCIGR